MEAISSCLSLIRLLCRQAKSQRNANPVAGANAVYETLLMPGRKQWDLRDTRDMNHSGLTLHSIEGTLFFEPTTSWKSKVVVSFEKCNGAYVLQYPMQVVLIPTLLEPAG